MERLFLPENFRKEGVASQVSIFLRFFPENRNITVPFAPSNMLLDEILGLFVERLYCSVWRQILTSFLYKWKVLAVKYYIFVSFHFIGEK